MTEIVRVPLSLREIRLNRTASYLRYGAIINGILAVGILLIGALAGINMPDLFTTTANITLMRYSGTADTALIIVMLIALANLSALLVLMIGVLAQEFWSPLAIWLVVAVNSYLLVVYGFIPALITILAASAAGLTAMMNLSAFRINPLMLKELRERMRGARAFVVMSVYLALMSAFAVLIFLIESNNSSATSVTGALGRNVFRGIIGLQLLLIVFIAPAFTAGAISSERERKTYDLLQITLLPKPSFVIGKLESALSYIFLLLLAAIPLQSMAFLFGGVTQDELIVAFVILVVTAIMLGTLGMYFSTTVDRTLTASVRAYTITFALTVGLPLVLGLVISILNQLFIVDQVNVSPILQSVLIYGELIVTSLNPLTAAIESQNLLINNQGLAFYTERLRDGTTIPLISPWIPFTILYLTTAAAMVVFAVRTMRQTDEVD